MFCRQGITQGVRSSTRAVRVAEERLRRLTNMSPTGFLMTSLPFVPTKERVLNIRQ